MAQHGRMILLNPSSFYASGVGPVPCPSCKELARVTAVEPHAPAQDKCTFRCDGCGNEFTRIVTFDLD